MRKWRYNNNDKFFQSTKKQHSSYADKIPLFYQQVNYFDRFLFNFYYITN